MTVSFNVKGLVKQKSEREKKRKKRKIIKGFSVTLMLSSLYYVDWRSSKRLRTSENSNDNIDETRSMISIFICVWETGSLKRVVWWKFIDGYSSQNLASMLLTYRVQATTWRSENYSLLKEFKRYIKDNRNFYFIFYYDDSECL